ncbi:hypothetical protein BDV09DRAFT_149635 [Aspergillus tetrazonus]
MRLMATAKSDGDWQQDTRRARGGAFLSPASRLSVVVVSGDAGLVWMEIDGSGEVRGRQLLGHARVEEWTQWRDFLGPTVQFPRPRPGANYSANQGRGAHVLY